MNELDSIISSVEEKSNEQSATDTGCIDAIVVELFAIGAIKFGEFTLKSGILSPIYIDVRIIVSFPALLSKISELMWKKMAGLKYDVICGVPYTALPIATVISIKHLKPMVMRRKEIKKYGTKKMIEGVFEAGQTCFIIEDLVTSGTSVLETAAELNKVELKVSDCIVLIDREQGGKENLLRGNIALHSCCTISDMLRILFESQKIDAKMVQNVTGFLQNNKNVKTKINPNLAINTNTNTNGNAADADVISIPNTNTTATTQPKRLPFAARSELCVNAIAKQLFLIMANKKTNLCCSADVSTAKEVLDLAANVGPFICVLKTHIDIITDYSPAFVSQLQALAVQHNFLLFEDRKFADIGSTVKRQFGEGIYHISQWAHIINAHTVPGPGIIEGLRQVSMESDRGNTESASASASESTRAIGHGLLLLAEMSSKGNLATNEYTSTTVALAEQNADFVIGYICIRQLSANPAFVHMTPGVHLQVKSDSIGQQYLTPEKVIQQNGSDMIIVGRGIYKASDSAKAAQKYRDAAWNAYLGALQQQDE